MSRVAVFPGSFDPMTMAHLDVARRAAALFDRLVIGVLHNPKKAPLFTVEERVAHDPARRWPTSATTWRWRPSTG